MGLRRLRGRLDAVQGQADQTLHMAQDLIGDLQDGFGVVVEVDSSKLMDMFTKLLTGVGLPDKFTLPISVKIEPDIDA